MRDRQVRGWAPAVSGRISIPVMHELSIAMNILEIVTQTCREQGYQRVDSVSVRIGRASGVMTEALNFAFECARSGTVADQARIVIEEVPVGGHCRDCGKGFQVDEAFVFACPLCGGTAFQITSGHELELAELEVDDEG